MFVYMCVYVYVCIYYMYVYIICMYVYICIYIERETERQRETEREICIIGTHLFQNHLFTRYINILIMPINTREKYLKYSIHFASIHDYQPL